MKTLKKMLVLMGVILITPAVTWGGNMNTNLEEAVFAGGCFWCMTPPFEKTEGVIKVVSGYTGGEGVDPTYQDYEEKGHIEAIQITYDPELVSYSELLKVYWLQVDPFDKGGQFCDRGHAYISGIFYLNEKQKKQAEASKQAFEKLFPEEKSFVTAIIPATEFYAAEEYHQQYYLKNPLKYKYYRARCGRDNRLKQLWGKNAGHSKSEKSSNEAKAVDKTRLLKKLTPLQYKVTQKEGTEPAFQNEYWDNKHEGIYVDIISGEPLFSSLDKFDSGTGWPSYNKPLESGNIVEKIDHKLFSTRTEVRSKAGESHLGHLFNDGPEPTGLRYCINSAALRFIPVEELEKEGYGKYLKMFKK